MYGKCQSYGHTAGIGFNGVIKEFADICKTGNSIKALVDFLAAQAEDRTVEVDVFAPGEFRVEPRAQLQQCGDTTVGLNLPQRRRQGAANYLQQCRLP
ncbi:hypothetical protein D3C78_1655670 [compost metagenome]